MTTINFPVTAREIGVRCFDDLTNYHQHQLDYDQSAERPIRITWKQYRRAIEKAKGALTKPTIGHTPEPLPPGTEIKLIFKGRELVPTSQEA